MKWLLNKHLNNATKNLLEMEQQFSLSWNNFHGNLTKGFAGLLGKGEFVDVTIAVEGHLLQAHKVILSICSPYFKKMFQMNPCQHPIVVLRDVTLKAMRDLLQFMYHGEVSVKQEDLTSFIGTAEVLQIKGLTNKETDEEDIVRQQDLPQQTTEITRKSPNGESCVSDTFDSSVNDDLIQDNIKLHKQREFIEKLQRLSNLKRKSEEYLPKTYYSDSHSTDKRPKFIEKLTLNKQDNHILMANKYDKLRNIYDENPVDITTSYNTNNQKQITVNDTNDKSRDESELDPGIDLKTECDDSDIIVTDPAVCTTPKSYNGSGDSHKDTPHPLDYQSPQDNCTSLNSLFNDLKNLVNGKMSNMLRTNISEEFPRNTVEHRLVTIPQKEDGKKKYPQRSCRLCWKIGRRRDTRFMCNSCELPFCKSPCFEVHYNDVLKVSQLQADYYAT